MKRKQLSKKKRKLELDQEYTQLTYIGLLNPEAIQKQRMLRLIAKKIDAEIENIWKNTLGYKRGKIHKKGEFMVSPMPILDIETGATSSGSENSPTTRQKRMLNEIIKDSKNEINRSDPSMFGRLKKYAQIGLHERAVKIKIKQEIPKIWLGEQYLQVYAHERAESLAAKKFKKQEKREAYGDVMGIIALKRIMNETKNSKVKVEIQKNIDKILKEDINPFLMISKGRYNYIKGREIIHAFLKEEISENEALKRIKKI